MKRTQFFDSGLNLEIKYKEIDYNFYEDETPPKDFFKTKGYRRFDLSKNERIELLAPASAITYKQAVYAGANAIYFGYGELNARANGDNVTSLKEVVDFCHFFGVKAYLALNIEIFDKELPQVEEVIKKAEDANIDAYIISDLALPKIIRKYSKAPIHASTQLGVHNRWGMEFLRTLCIDRAVLSREVTINDIRDIKEYSDVETEVFIHGALCVGFSGACLLSSMLTGNSGNRGRCNQLCRQKYECYLDGKKIDSGYLLSAKDICAAQSIDELIDLKVTSLKIEGRLKRPEYVYGVTRFYSDMILLRKKTVTLEEVKKLFNRGDFTDGYFANNNIIYPEVPNHIGVYAGKVVTTEGKVGYVSAPLPLKPEDGFKVLRNRREMGGALVTGVKLNRFYEIKTNFILKPGDELRLTSDNDLAEKFNAIRKIKYIALNFELFAGKKAVINMIIDGYDFRYETDLVVPKAINIPLMPEEIISAFKKGISRSIKFEVDQITMNDVFLTKAQLNYLRKQSIEAAWRFALGLYVKPRSIYYAYEPEEYPLFPKSIGNFVEISDISQLDLVYMKFSNIVYNPSVYDKEKCQEFAKKASCGYKRAYIKIPPFVPTSKEEFFEDIIEYFDGVVANSVGAICIAQKMDKLAVCGPSMNITNTQNWLVENTSQFVVSTELNAAQLKKFSKYKPLVYAYGYLPLMYLNHCPRKQVGLSCGDCEGEIKLRDEKGEYLITTQKFDGYCEHVLHNAVLTDLGRADLKAYRYIDFSLASNEEITTMIDNYFHAKTYDPGDSNKLHLNRGVK